MEPTMTEVLLDALKRAAAAHGVPSQGPDWAREKHKAEPRPDGRARCRGSPGEPRPGHWNSHPAGGAGLILVNLAECSPLPAALC